MSRDTSLMLDASEEIPSLIETLFITEQRLEALTGGEVDTVAGRDGRTFLLGRAQEQLRYSEAAKQTAILNALPANIALLDAQGVIVSVNEAWRQFAISNVLHAPGHGIGLNYLDICDGAHGDSSTEAKMVAVGIRSVLNGKNSEFSIEYPCNSPTEQRWFLLSVAPLAGPHAGGAVVMHLNISERKQTEEKLRRTDELYRRAIAGAGAVPYSSDDKSKSYLFMGEGIQELIGYSPSEVTGQLWKQIIQESVMTGDTAGLSKDEASRRMAKGEIAKWGCDMRVLTRDGKSRWLSDSSVQRLDQTGQPVGATGIIQDITERKLAEISSMLAEISSMAFSKLSRDLSSASSAKEAGQLILDISDTLLSWDCCWIGLYDSDKNVMRPVLQMDTVNGKRFTEPSIESEPVSKLQRQILESGGQLILRENTDTFLPGARPIGDKTRPSVSLMFVPIRYRNRNIGVLSIQSYTSNAYTKQSLGTLQSLADQCGGALERIRADEALRESEDMLRRVMDSSQDCIKILDLEGRLVWMNEGGQSIMEIDAFDTVKNQCWVNLWPSEERPAALAVLELAKNNKIGKFSGFCPTAKGSPRWWEVVVTQMLDEAGNPEKLLSVSRDITDRRRAEMDLRLNEQRYRSLVKATTAMVWSTPASGEFEVEQPDWSAFTGQSFEELHGWGWLNAVHPDDQAETASVWSAAVASRSLYKVEHRLRFHDQAYRNMQVSAVPILAEDGTILQWIGIHTDITERKTAEAALEEANRQLREASRQAGMSEVATSVLHNVGNVLNSVNVSCSIISDKVRQTRISSVAKTAELFREHAGDLSRFLTDHPAGKKLPEYLGKLAVRLAEEHKAILDEVESLSKNIEHIKSVISMQQTHAKNMGGHREALPLQELMEDALRLNEGALTRHRIKVVREFFDAPIVQVDKHKVLQILVNLLRNAKHALTDSGREDKQLLLRIARSPEGVALSVIDNGIGIPAENLLRIFGHRFTTKNEGHGFGLHSAAIAAKEMGGSLTVNSDGAGTGATFTLTLPLSAIGK